MGKKKDAEAPAAPAEKITQRVAVQRAIAAGKDSPPDGVAYVKEQFGITLNNGSFSTIKSQLKKAGGMVTSPGKRGRPAGVKATPAAAPSSNGHGNPADLARAVKSLVTQYGADAVKGMAEVFAE
jgi:hypothetical protein